MTELTNREIVKPSIHMDSYPTWYRDIGKFASRCRSGSSEIEDYKRLEGIGRHCVKSHHFAATRPFQFCFRISDISRVCAQQLLRHTIGVLPMMESGRHVNIESNKVIIPISVLQNSEALDLYVGHISASKEVYKKLVDLGIPMEDARMATMQAETTSLTIYVTLESLLNLFSERTCAHAQWEIKSLVWGMYDVFVKDFPELKKEFSTRCDKIGVCLETNGCGRFA